MTSSSDGSMSDAFFVEVSSGSPATIQELVVYFLRAVERFREQAGGPAAADDQFHNQSLAAGALAEALSWADTIDQYLVAGPKGTKGTERNAQWTAELEEDQRLLALAFQRVRNVVHHQWWQAISVRISSGIEPPVREFIWGRLPSNARTHRDKEGDAGYAARLQGRDLLETLDDLGAIFWAKRTWQIARADVLQPGHEVAAPLTFDDEPEKVSGGG